MDFFGIGNAIEASTHMYLRASRGSGRTVSMIDGLKSGDRVIFASQKESKRVQRLFKEEDLNIDCIVVDPRTPDRLFQNGSNQGRTIFDHSWIEEYYLLSIKRCKDEIDNFQTQLSGYGEPHRKTRRAAFEASKWTY